MFCLSPLWLPDDRAVLVCNEGRRHGDPATEAKPSRRELSSSHRPSGVSVMPIADSAAPSIDFLVRKDALTDTRFVEGPSAADTTLATGEVLLAVDSYAMTANNITYAVFGEMMNYWDFFPAPESWGRIPVWGFAEIVASAHPDLKVGERVY
ncbi:MAG: hypothetical protein ACI91F_003706, partial [Candidatus Binatia bacterium]